MGKILALISGLMIAIGFAKKAEATNDLRTPINTGKSDFNYLYKKYGQKFGVDWKLIKAHIIVESGENPSAVNPSDPSYGLGQVLCTGNGEYCSNKFPAVSGWKNGRKRKDLLNPEINVSDVAEIIAWNTQHYPLDKAIAIYNNYSAVNQSAPFSNQSYVDKVLKIYRSL